MPLAACKGKDAALQEQLAGAKAAAKPAEAAAKPAEVAQTAAEAAASNDARSVEAQPEEPMHEEAAADAQPAETPSQQ